MGKDTESAHCNVFSNAAFKKHLKMPKLECRRIKGENHKIVKLRNLKERIAEILKETSPFSHRAVGHFGVYSILLTIPAYLPTVQSINCHLPHQFLVLKKRSAATWFKRWRKLVYN